MYKSVPDKKIKTDLANYDNTSYKPGKNVIVRGIWYIINVFFFINPLNPFVWIKVFLLRIFGARIGIGAVIKPSVNIKYPWRLSIGNHVWIGEKVWIDNLDEVVIGDNCCISQESLLLTGNHNFKSKNFNLITGAIVMEDGVWIGARSLVTLNTKCLSHSVLSAGSVLSSNMDAYSIYKGNPAIKIKERIIE
jgi:putative colanic acid biosynthesis acetyltransferase WcaF